MIEIVRQAIDVAGMLAELTHPADGAQALFLGNVRDHHEGRGVRYLEYDAYEEMAVAQLEAVRTTMLDRFEIRDLAIVHRIGRIEIGEAAVAVLAVSAHRGPAFDACRTTMDTVKKTVPIFKREFYEDGDRWIEGGTT